MPVVAAKGWAILTKDKRIRRRAIEREAINESRAGAFIFAGSDLGGEALSDRPDYFDNAAGGAERNEILRHPISLG